MKRINPPFLRNQNGYFVARAVISIAFIAAMILVVARTDSTSKAQSGCTTDPVVANDLDSGVRLPNSLAPGVCHVTIKAQGRTSNTGTIRIAP